ncbi:MAG: hypothetical protein KJO79_08700 [Verrucomicrobiae bacterium]|nr:hypothetical protein [Verrucomicrobiae bacterium]NNJ87245.1 hypothetical protein [Akkermansiaceae bacterium]
MSSIVRALLVCTTTVCLTQCADLGVYEKSRPVVRLDKPPRGWQHEAPATSARVFGEVYQQVILARGKEAHAPTEALRHYLQAADKAYHSRDKNLLPLYNHAVGQIVDLLVQYRGRLAGPSISMPPAVARLLKSTDDIIPVDCLKAKGWRTIVRQVGVGAPIVIRRGKDRIEGLDRTLATPIGQSYAATAIIEFSKGTRPRLRLYDPSARSMIFFWGKNRPLAYNLTMPLAVSLEEGSPAWKDVMLKWFGVFMPMEFVKEMKLYTTTPFDSNKVPLVLVHGLKADPSIWHNVMNELNADPVIREKYHIFAFYYPTGLPFRIPSAALKREINRLYGYYAQAGHRRVAKQMVIVGHSLGGLLTSVQIRNIDKNLMSRIFSSPVDENKLNPAAIKDYRYLINGPRPDFVKRVIFISTPHRGSRNADIYPIRLLSNLIKIPQNLLFLKVPETSAALTDFGRSLFGPEKKENSLSLLQSRSATLKILSDSPIYKNIPYHSIIGDRGRGNTPDSTDGVVDYKSSHLDGAQSELIVPSGHDAYEHPLAIREMIRILRLNLDE